MDVFVGRQPILDRRLRTVAYELLFRSNGGTNQFDGTDADVATGAVVSNTFLTIGCNRALGGRTGFINFPRRFLVEDGAFMLPRDKVVVEILEDVEPDSAVVDACRRLKEAGYIIALDDVVATDHVAALTPYAQYVKIDFRELGTDERRKVGDHFLKLGLKLLAEKVETTQDFEQAVRCGYTLFQGYFFARPEILSAREIPTSKLGCLRLLTELQRPDLDFVRLEELLRLDIAMVRKLLLFVNSAAFSFQRHINTISRALVALGEGNIRKWVALSVIPSLATDKPAAVVTSSLSRARFCELAAEQSGLRQRAADAFLVGLFSQLDVLIGRPVEELISEMALDTDISNAILGKSLPGDGLRRLLELAMAFEGTVSNRVSDLAVCAKLAPETASELYVQAIEWADALNRIG